MKQSNSSITSPSPLSKMLYMFELFKMRFRHFSNPPTFQDIFDDIDRYGTILKSQTSLELEKSSILEIGFGARPNRLKSMNSMDFDIRGIDLDVPVTGSGFRQFVRIYRSNGIERATKSFIRHFLFDTFEERALKSALESRGYGLKRDLSVFLQADAGDEETKGLFSKGSMDLITSEDVFEHIPPATLKTAIDNIHFWLSDTGIAIICPDIFTGITGGHLTDWYPAKVLEGAPRATEPWEHLRKKRVVASTYLNELRPQQYRDLLEEKFEIVEELDMRNKLGEHLLTDEVLREAEGYTRKELMTSKTMFVLRKKNPHG